MGDVISCVISSFYFCNFQKELVKNWIFGPRKKVGIFIMKCKG